MEVGAGAEASVEVEAGVEAEASVETEAEAGVDAGADEALVAEAALDLDSEINAAIESPGSDPMDPNLDDTESIMKRYEENDIKKELDQKSLSVGSDLSGGIDKIAANSFSHNAEADNIYLRKLVEGYLQHGFDPSGMPNGKMTLEKWNG